MALNVSRYLRVSKFLIKFGNSAQNLVIWFWRKSLIFVAHRCQIIRLKWPISISAGSLPQILGYLAGFKGLLLREGREIGGNRKMAGERGRGGEWESGRWEGRGGNKWEGRGGDHKGWFTPPCLRSWKYPDCRTDLTGGDGNTDVCPGWQEPSRRHCGLRLRLANCRSFEGRLIITTNNLTDENRSLNQIKLQHKHAHK